MLFIVITKMSCKKISDFFKPIIRTNTIDTNPEVDLSVESTPKKKQKLENSELSGDPFDDVRVTQI